MKTIFKVLIWAYLFTLAYNTFSPADPDTELIQQAAWTEIQSNKTNK